MNIFAYVLIKFIKFYKFLISPLIGETCRYFPSCSDYSIEALKTFGLIKGIYLSLKRILSCNPWSKGGVDLVVKENEGKK